VRSVAFSPTTPLLASGSDDYSIRVWDVNDGRCLKILPEHTHSVLSVAFTPRGDKLLSSSGDQTLKLWDVSSGKCLRTFEGHADWVRGVAVHQEISSPVVVLMQQCVFGAFTVVSVCTI
jgi:WD40 repeat protein